jgi:hypothetical protein
MIFSQPLMTGQAAVLREQVAKFFVAARQAAYGKG